MDFLASSFSVAGASPKANVKGWQPEDHVVQAIATEVGCWGEVGSGSRASEAGWKGMAGKGVAGK